LASGVSGWVMPMIVAPCSRATSTASSSVGMRPMCEIASTTSRDESPAAEDELDVRVVVRVRRDAEAREARLRVVGENVDVEPTAVALDAPRRGDSVDGRLDHRRVELLLEIGQHRGGAVEDLVDDAGSRCRRR